MSRGKPGGFAPPGRPVGLQVVEGVMPRPICKGERMKHNQLLAVVDGPTLEAGMPVPHRDDGGPHWPRLDAIGLSAAAVAARRAAIGGSDANILLSGDAERILRLWREKRGEAVPEDLTGKLAVMTGCWTEAFNRQWFEWQTGQMVSEIGSVWDSLTHPWRRATLDGFVESRKAVWEAKHTSAFAKDDEVLARYMPQLQHNMAVANLDLAILSVLYGNHKWETYEIARDWLYQDELLDAEQSFWAAVQAGTTPVVAAAPSPPKPVAYRELCFDGNNAWASHAADWVANVAPARRHAASVKALKELIPEDVCRAWGHKLEAKRSKSGALTFREIV